MFIDSHCHLYVEKLEPDLPGLLRRAQEQNVRRVISASSDRESNRLNKSIAEEYPGAVLFTAGIHPHDVQDMTAADMDMIAALLEHKSCCALGEVGLDFYYTFSEKEKQLHWLAAQIDLARQLNKPVVLHSRGAETELLQFLIDTDLLSGLRGILHCYTGPADIFKSFITRSRFYYSFGGMVTFKTADNVRDLLGLVPLDKLLLETDSPYLSPVPYRGKVNEPAHIIYVADCIARLKNISVSELESVTETNFNTLFGELP